MTHRNWRILALGALLSLSAVACAAPSMPLQALDVFKLQYATDPRISPDGLHIVYVRQSPDIMTDRRYANLWMVEVDGGGHHPLTTGKHNDVSPRWSPDGRQIAYISNRDGAPAIHILRIDTQEEIRAVKLPQSPGNINWSPDGKSLAFTMLVPAAPLKIANMPSPPAGAEWAKPALVTDAIVYRTDDAGYIRTGEIHLFTLPAAGGVWRDITKVSNVAWDAPRISWAPDGQSIVFSGRRSDDASTRAAVELQATYSSNVFEVRLGTGEVRQLTHRKGPNDNPKVSPDGRLIAYTGFDDRYVMHQTTSLYVMQRDGTNQRVLSGNLDRDIAELEWDARGDRLYVLYDSEGVTTLARIQMNGKVTAIADNIGWGMSAERPGRSFSMARNGRYAIPYTTVSSPGDVATGLVGRNDMKRVTNLNSDLLAARQLPGNEKIEFQSAKDAQRLEGWIMTPPEFDPNKKYPLILHIHGGPTLNYGPRFDFENQLMAARGYVVLYMNPRGSTSYGENFSNFIDKAFPGEEFADFMAGVDAVLSRGYVDDKRLYVTGGSGGGVYTTWVITRTNRFRAAAILFPVIDFSSWALTADLGITGSKYYFNAAPWEAPEMYAARSLVLPVEKVRTPAIIICGENDYRTPISQAEQYYSALKWRGVDTVLVRVPEANHTIEQRPSQILTKVLNTIDWFESHQ